MKYMRDRAAVAKGLRSAIRLWTDMTDGSFAPRGEQEIRRLVGAPLASHEDLLLLQGEVFLSGQLSAAVQRDYAWTARFSADVAEDVGRLHDEPGEKLRKKMRNALWHHRNSSEHAVVLIAAGSVLLLVDLDD